MTVALPAEVKGTHMSRFIEVLEELAPDLRNTIDFLAMARRVRARLGAANAAIEARFPYFVRKVAPVSRAASLLDCDVAWRAECGPADACELSMGVETPVTSLCPCSREISDYGAHNQRSSVRIDARLSEAMPVEHLVAIAESAASCEVYGLLKRADEKHVTERAYDNPKFVEDLVRDVALALAREPRVLGYVVEAENFESIHNHSAFARIRSARA
jgi:MptA/FolE2 family GTP cyclohydrolase